MTPRSALAVSLATELNEVRTAWRADVDRLAAEVQAVHRMYDSALAKLKLAEKVVEKARVVNCHATLCFETRDENNRCAIALANALDAYDAGRKV